MMKYSPFIACALLATMITVSTVNAAETDSEIGQSAAITDQLQSSIDTEMTQQLQGAFEQENEQRITIMARERQLLESSPLDLDGRLYAVTHPETKTDF